MVYLVSVSHGGFDELCRLRDLLPEGQYELDAAIQDARLVSASDKLHNARAIVGDYRQHRDGLWQRFNAGRDGILWYYDTLVRAFPESGDHGPLVDELDRTVRTLVAVAGDSAPR